MLNSDGVGWLTQEVAGILRGARARRGITQAELARVAGVSQSQLSKMLLGKRDITIDQLDWMCHELELDLYKVLMEADDETSARFTQDPKWPDRREQGERSTEFRVAGGTIFVVDDDPLVEPTFVETERGSGKTETVTTAGSFAAGTSLAPRPDEEVDRVLSEAKAEIGKARGHKAEQRAQQALVAAARKVGRKNERERAADAMNEALEDAARETDASSSDETA